ncbi:phospholipase D family protein [Falsirhodobacter deserti]|uniref:phospholipase D family protein n=1 Tax=Falsirhodobacter deserti TaxID=1365611 RepID=UPI001F4D6EED|nr:phospholipase D-like domain-containing protein [Falsirhodobacter deserti]
MRRTSTQVFITGAEAFPELERAFLEAQSQIRASFRIFDPRTRLRSKEGQAVGATWFDLIVHVLRKGVAVHLTITDFDPIARPSLHQGTWRSLRMLRAAQELAGPAAKLDVVAAMHPAQSGWLIRLLFWPAVQHRLGRICRRLNSLAPAEREAALRDLPGLRQRLQRRADGTCRPRRLHVPRLFPATHHQKLAVFDRRKLYIGGLDLDERRYDTPTHDRPADETWHDVQVMIEGPVVAEAQAHLESFLDVAEGTMQPMPQRRLLRTLSRRRRVEFWRYGPETVAHELNQAHEALAGRARRLIYLETQFFRSLPLARHLAAAARNNPDLTLILILPAAPDDVAFDDRPGIDVRFGEYLQARALRILRAGFGNRIFIGGAAQPRRAQKRLRLDRDRLRGAPLIYIHAKVSIFDDTAAIVSSANLNGRSLFWDSEAGVYLNVPRDVQELRRRTMAHWLPVDAGSHFFDPRTAARAWSTLALQNQNRAPEDRRGFILPYDLRAAEEFGINVPVPDEMV